MSLLRRADSGQRFYTPVMPNPRHLRYVSWFALLVGLAGCTLQHIEEDTAEVLEWVRLKSGTEVRTVSRWQIPPGARIVVVETAPAAEPLWLPAAQLGVDAVFPPAAAAGVQAEHYELLVSWPMEAGRTRRVSLWEVIALDALTPDFQEPMALQVALIRPADGALVDAGALRISPHWFKPESGSPALVKQAFQSFAARLKPKY